MDIYLESLAVSRQHAKILCHDGEYFIEDLGSSNGTYVNGEKIHNRLPLGEHDVVQIGPYLLASAGPTAGDAERSTEPDSSGARLGHARSVIHTLLNDNASQKFQVVLEIAQDAGPDPR